MSKIRHKHLLPTCIIVFSLLIALRLALSSEVKSSIRILARLGMPIESQDLLQITSLRPKAHIVKIIEQHVQPGLPSQQRNPEISDDHIIISAVDAEKKEVFRVNQIDPRLIRAEWEESPGILTTNNFYLNEVNFGIALPNNHNIKNLEIYQVRWTGKDIRMEFLGDVQLAQMTISSYMYPTESVSPIRYNGDPANRVDLVILGDGYTQNELAKFSSNAETAVNGLFDENPFQEYSDFFNVLRVDVISNESGADHPSKEIYKDTALNATYGTGGTIRALTVNKSKVEAILENNIPANQRDLILVIVNDTEYGGTGGSIAVALIHPSCIELVLHELRHSFGLLGDEYTYGGTNCDNPFEPNLPNVTTLTERNKIKWNVISASTERISPLLKESGLAASVDRGRRVTI
jgi:hypothetical protein